MDRTDKLLSIIDRLLWIIEYEQLCDALDEEDIVDDWTFTKWSPNEFTFSSECKDEEEDEEFDDYKDCRSHINEDWLPENNLVKCIWVDKDWNGIYKFK